jgi:hypothetical protein
MIAHTISQTKVLFVYSDRVCSCTAKRTFEVLQALHQYKKGQIDLSAIFYLNLTEKEFQNYDIILFQRLGANGGEITSDYRKQLFNWMERFRDQTIYVYDIDDYLFDRQGSFPIEMMSRCHVALSPNEYLKGEIERFQPNCRLIRTHIDLASAESAPTINFKKKYPPDITHIGWFSTGAQGVELIKVIYPALLEKWLGRVLIHVYVDELFLPIFQPLQQGIILPHPTVPLKQMYGLEREMDILINPLEIHSLEKMKFLYSKSEIKYLHAAAAKKPLIASPIPAYQKAISHGKTGFLATTPQEWLLTIEQLILEPETRNKVGQAAYLDVSANYTYPQVAERYFNFFQDLKSCKT